MVSNVQKLHLLANCVTTVHQASVGGPLSVRCPPRLKGLFGGCEGTYRAEYGPGRIGERKMMHRMLPRFQPIT